MQTLVINGSPRKNGDTEALVNAFISHLNGEIKTISCCSDISPCIDCRYCWENTGCALNDGMQEVYRFLETCDNIVLASPIWFSSLSGPLLNILSRVQAIWAASYFQKKNLLPKEKKGVIILAGAQPETKDIPTRTAISIMKYLNVHRPSVSIIYSLDTNHLPASQDELALEKCREAADILNTGEAPCAKSTLT